MTSNKHNAGDGGPVDRGVLDADLALGAAVDGDHRAAAAREHLRKRDAVGDAVGHAHLARDGSAALAAHAPDNLLDEARVVREVRAVRALLGDALRAAEVHVDRHALARVLEHARRLHHRVRVAAGQLCDRRPVLCARLERLFPERRVLHVDCPVVCCAQAVKILHREIERGKRGGGHGWCIRMNHRRDAEVGAVALAEEPEGQHRAVDHRREEELGLAQRLAKEAPRGRAACRLGVVVGAVRRENGLERRQGLLCLVACTASVAHRAFCEQKEKETARKRE